MNCWWRWLWQQELAAAGYESTACARADKAIELLGSDWINAAIIDVGLPGGMPGDELALQCRQRFPGLAIMLVTGFDSSRYRNLELDGTACVLQKPIDTAALLSCLRGMLRLAAVDAPWTPTPR